MASKLHLAINAINEAAVHAKDASVFVAAAANFVAANRPADLDKAWPFLDAAARYSEAADKQIHHARQLAYEFLRPDAAASSGRR
jgi:hypothetical protein